MIAVTQMTAATFTNQGLTQDAWRVSTTTAPPTTAVAMVTASLLNGSIAIGRTISTINRRTTTP